MFLVQPARHFLDKMPKKKLKLRTAKNPTTQNTPPITVNDKVDAGGSVKTAGLTTVTPPVLMKVCRLCEAKDGPFLNIFDADKVTARKIEELMPFGVSSVHN